MNDVDAIVIGAGVAGCAAALELLDAGWQVKILHQLDHISTFESLSSDAVRKLDILSIRVGSPFTEVVAWWGAECEKRGHRPGARIVQRAALAAALRARAIERGAELNTSGKIHSIEQFRHGWEVLYGLPGQDCRRVIAQHLVDATGRASIIGRRMGARRILADSLFCVSGSVYEAGLVGTWTESTSDGWWNLCCGSEGGTLSFYSNASTIREARRDIIGHFKKTSHIQHLLQEPELVSSNVRACGSSCMSPSAGPGWICVGDAASTLQPLASAGVLKALRDSRLVRRALEHGPVDYDRLQQSEFKLYALALAKQYALENRWSDSKFWAWSIPTDFQKVDMPLPSVM